MIYDILIVGCGVIGASIAFELSKYDLQIAVLEKENDVSCGTTKANSGIVHAGFDVPSGTLAATLNLQGSECMERLCRDLSVSYKRTGSLVLAFHNGQKEMLDTLYERGKTNGVCGLEIWDREKLRRQEPNVTDDALCALYAPTAAIVNPWELCLAQIETACQNGVHLFLNSPVEKIEFENGIYAITASEKVFWAKLVINAAGLYADQVHALVSHDNEFEIFPNKGEYFLLDKSQGNLVQRVVFQAPTEKGKGVLVAPTVHGNLIVGPDSASVRSRSCLAVTSQGLSYVKKMALQSVPGIDFKENIRNFTGLRAYSTEDDFIIRESKTAKKFINVAGIKSPGLSAAPGIAHYVSQLLRELDVKLFPKQNFVSKRQKIAFKNLDAQSKNEYLAKDKTYGHIVCRCETVTEAEIKYALNGTVKPVSLDGVKRRTCAGLGRCQGGFCSPKVLALISDAHKMPVENVVQENSGSYIVTGPTKGGDCSG